MNRKVAVVGAAIVLGSVLAGCGGGQGESNPPARTGQDSSTTPTTSPRKGPAKAIDVADKCSIVAEQEWRALGSTEPPTEMESNDNAGCRYQSATAGEVGWGVFLAAASDSTYQEKTAMMETPTSTDEIDGYPASTFGDSNGCVVVADVADEGYLLTNAIYTGDEDSSVDLCQKAQEFAKAAIQNLPNAEG